MTSGGTLSQNASASTPAASHPHTSSKSSPRMWYLSATDSRLAMLMGRKTKQEQQSYRPGSCEGCCKHLGWALQQCICRTKQLPLLAARRGNSRWDV